MQAGGSAGKAVGGSAGAATGGATSGGPGAGGASGGSPLGGSGGQAPMTGGKAAASGGRASSGEAGSGGGGGRGGDPAGGAPSAGAGGGEGCDAPADYDALVLCNEPIGYWAMDQDDSEPDLTGRGKAGTYQGGAPDASELPNGDRAAAFDGESQYLTIPSSKSYSIPTTGELTWEAWIRPAVLQFENDSGGYVDWMGKCAEYGPTCEWEARMYNAENSQDRCNRLSAYAFNPGAGLGSGADFQPECGLFEAGDWLHVVGEYTLKDEPENCEDTDDYPGSIEIWVNGVQWNHARHGQTGCMSQYEVVPEANDSPVNVGTMARDAWFQGAIGKVAIYDRLLTQAEITAHYRSMTGASPTGSCDDTCSF
jgi:hypothetical protein